LVKVVEEMRILIAGVRHGEVEAIRRAMEPLGDRFEIVVSATPLEFGIRLREEIPTVPIIADLAKGWDAPGMIRLAGEVRPGCIRIGIVRKGRDADARALAEAGALDAFPIDQLWRLPRALNRVAEGEARAAADAHARGMEILLETVKRLSMARRIEDIVEAVRTSARRIAQADGATFVLRDGNQCHYVDEDAIGPLWRGRRFPMSACISGWAMLNRRPAVVPDIYADPRVPIEAYRPTFVKSLAMVPIRTEDPIGAIGIYWARNHTVAEAELFLIQALADSAALAVDNVQAYANLERRVRERTASLEAVNKELEAFARSVSHDLRSPLAVILGYAEMLGDEARVDLGKPDRAKIRDIRSAALRMNALIDDMLRLSQVIQREVELKRVDLSAMAEEILNGMRAGEPERTVSVIVQPGLIATGDPGLLRIAVENLLANAWKYSSKREAAHIEVGETGAGDDAAFFVKDDGAGFDMDQARKLFKPFQRLHASSEFPGTGIGLATVSRVLEKHGGRVWAEAEKGKGATFFFRLPAATVVAPIPQAAGLARAGAS
jgi:signal transduction histidine kinase